MWTVKLKLCSMIFQRKSRCDTDTTFTQKPSIRLRTINPLLCFVIVPFKPRVNFWLLSTIHTKANIQQTVHYQSCFSSIKIVGGSLMEIQLGRLDWQNGATVFVLILILVWENSFSLFYCVNFLICWNYLIVFFSSVFLFQSKEIAFQLQEDLMKVLNELYTVSSNDCPVFN